ncbi:MAG: ArsA family ATPase [Solirubrobacteraceae bacterium]|nr:ArsA family ATPase [Solirubrobacteraceae bacterium]
MSGVWPALQRADVIVAAGAGGVGKTTVSAALGLALAREGRRVLVLTVDPARRLADALGHDLGPDPSVVRLPREPELHAAMLDAPASFRRVVQRLPVRDSDRRRLLGSRITKELTGGDAGMQELMAIVELERFCEDDAYDAIVLDTPPALHALELLDGPERIVGLLAGRTVRTVGLASGLAGRFSRLPGPGRALGKLWGADLLSEIATFLDAARPFGEALSGHLDHAQQLLRSERAAFVLVTAPAEVPGATAADLAAELRRRGHPIAGTIVNRHRAPLDAGLDADALGEVADHLSAAGLPSAARLATHLAAVAEHEQAMLTAAALPAPSAHLAERPAQERPEQVLSALASALAG